MANSSSSKKYELLFLVIVISVFIYAFLIDNPIIPVGGGIRDLLLYVPGFFVVLLVLFAFAGNSKGTTAPKSPPRLTLLNCSHCGFSFKEEDNYVFCPVCGHQLR